MTELHELTGNWLLLDWDKELYRGKSWQSLCDVISRLPELTEWRNNICVGPGVADSGEGCFYATFAGACSASYSLGDR